MSHSIDPVDSFYEGINSTFVSVITGMSMLGSGFATNWTAHWDVPKIPASDFIELPGGIVAMMQFGWICCAVFWLGTIYLLANDHISGRIGLFALYTFACGIAAPIGLNGDYWWMPFLIYLTVTGYYWFGFGLLMRQINRRLELDQD